MTRLALGSVVLLSLSLTTSCADESRGKEVVAPDALAAGASVATSRDDDSDGDDDDVEDMRFVEITDDCDPRDPAWNGAPGGCMQRNGTVSFAEFGDELDSPHSTAVVGHESWRNDPPYGVIRQGQTIRVRNTGGRPHTFTKVAEFGGGRASSPFNKGLTPVGECQGVVPNVPAGGRTQVSGLTPGNHRFMCCNHPWMRAVVEVRAR